MREVDSIADSGSAEFKTRSLKNSAELLYKNEEFIPLLLLIVCGIDALSGGEKQKFLNGLNAHFPELCAELPADEFYRRFRNGMAHLFSPKANFGIDRDSEMNGNYTEDILFNGCSIKSVNIDRLYNDFLKFVEKLR